MDKHFQIEILQIISKNYPFSAESCLPTLYQRSKGETDDEKQIYLAKHLKALEAFGYIEDLGYECRCDEIPNFNPLFKITEEGLVKAGIDIIHPSSYEDLISEIIAQASSLRDLAPHQKQTIGKILAQFPLDALKHLQEKGLDILLSLLWP